MNSEAAVNPDVTSSTAQGALLPVGYLPTSYRAKKTSLRGTPRHIHNDKMHRATFRFGTSKVRKRCVHVNHLLFTADTEGKINF
jgi:hypothetical protein